ncbi:MAG: hypothetical protein AB8G77_04095 [Rhodothermales bacterium]
MKKSTPLIVDDALPSHTFLELIHDEAFTPVFFPEMEKPHMRLIKHTHLSGEQLKAQAKPAIVPEQFLKQLLEKCRRFFSTSV